MTAIPSSVDPVEIEKFSALAAQWWDTNGSFKVLHQFNPLRIRYIRDHACAHFARSADTVQPLSGLSLLDIGCGGGLLSEPMARLGADVTGIDASPRNIAVARTHAAQSGACVTYHAIAAEEAAATGQRYDLVLAMEIIEHVNDPVFFLQTCAALMNDRGLLFIATLNRTLKSHLLAIIGAEYVLRWLPIGTHDWKKFIKIPELQEYMKKSGLVIRALDGCTYNPLSGRWKLGMDTDVNFILSAARP